MPACVEIGVERTDLCLIRAKGSGAEGLTLEQVKCLKTRAIVF
jgi:hypothetical protein